MQTEIVRKRMNREFRVKVNYGSMSLLVGWEGLVNLLGRHRAYLCVCEALESKTDKWTWKSRKGLKLSFYVK